MSLSRDALQRLLGAARPEGEPDLLGRYELRGELGRGGMGVVHEAWDRELGRVVAIKLLGGWAGLSEEARARFVREARAAARLSHPNIAAVHDATPEALVMQRLEGRTLAEEAPSDPRVLAELFRDAALALHHAHGLGLVHRDVKPGNLVVEPGPPRRVVVTDFGLAKETAVDVSLSSSGAVLGTPQFMAPEQARGEPADARSDVYGLGASLYACLAGRPPHEATDVVRLLRAVCEDDPPPLPRAVPRDLAVVVRKATAKEPARRYPSALALASDLDRWLTGRPVDARPPSLVYLARRALSRRRGAVVAAAGAAALVVAALAPTWLAARARSRLAEEALALSDVVAATLQNVRTFRDLGRDRLAEEALARAVTRCEAFLAGRGDVGRVHDFLGRLHEQRGDVEAARREFDRALELDPELATARVDRGILLALRHGDHLAREDLAPVELEGLRRAALADLAVVDEAGAGLTPTRVLFARALRAFLEGELVEAERGLLEVVEQDDLHEDAYLSLARLYVRGRRDEEALRMSVKAADLMRGHRPTYRAQRGSGAPAGPAPPVALRALPGLEELVHDFGAALDAHPSAGNGLAKRGGEGLRDALFELGRGGRGEALRHLEIAAREYDGALGTGARPELHLDRGVCHALRARVLDAAGRHAEARLAARAAREDYDAAAALGGADPALDVARAVADLREAAIAALEGHPGDAEAAAGRARAALERAEAALAAEPALAAHVRALRRAP